MYKAEFISCTPNRNGSLTVTFLLHTPYMDWYESRSFYGYSKREAIKLAREQFNDLLETEKSKTIVNQP